MSSENGLRSHYEYSLKSTPDDVQETIGVLHGGLGLPLLYAKCPDEAISKLRRRKNEEGINSTHL